MKELAIIIPTYNEGQNVPVLVERINRLQWDTEYEIVIVDDNSPYKTWQIAQVLQKAHLNLRSIRRIGRKGLSSAVIEGVLATNTRYIAVIDADLQHDETILTTMLQKGRAGVGVVIGSRYVDGGGVVPVFLKMFQL